jgi:hypothetical protein
MGNRKLKMEILNLSVALRLGIIAREKISEDILKAYSLRLIAGNRKNKNKKRKLCASAPLRENKKRKIMSILESALLGGAIGLAVFFISHSMKKSKFAKIKKALGGTDADYLVHYASSRKFKNGLKFFDSYGLFTVNSNTSKYYVRPENPLLQFDLSSAVVTDEGRWRNMNWFSITDEKGEKHYFNAHIAGAWKVNNTKTTELMNQLMVSKMGG